MIKSFIHLMAFFSKEVNEVIRQPRLLLSLILGPFMVLLLFGISYNGGLPNFRVALVAPPESISSEQLNKVKESITRNFTLVSDNSDEAAAMEMLHRREVDIVEILPTNIEQNVAEGKQSSVRFEYSVVNPFDESWLEYLCSAQVNAMNRTLLEQAVRSLQEQSNVLTNLPPETVVSPLVPEYQNLRGGTIEFMNFYAPSVLALILQHIAVTLGALSLVREHARGTLEMFRIAPVSSFDIITGKYLGYTLFLGIMASILVGLIIVLGTPFLGNVVLFILLVLLLITASLGIGFLISCVSKTDSTAVQLSMLTLLVSIFFSGFFLPLENFNSLMLPFTNIVPLTHAIKGFQNIMLEGTAPSPFIWIGLALITLVTYIAVQLLFRRLLHRL